MKLLKTISGSYKNKVMISLLAIIILPAVALLMISHSSLVSSYKQEVLKRDRNIFHNNVAEIDRALNQLEAEVVELQANSTLKNFFRTSSFSGDILYAYHQYIENILTWESMLKPKTVKNYVFFTENRNIPRSEQIRLLEDLPSSVELDTLRSAFEKGDFVVELVDESNIDGTNKYPYNYGYYLFFSFILNEQYYTVIQVEVDMDNIVQDLNKSENCRYILHFGDLGAPLKTHFGIQTQGFGPIVRRRNRSLTGLNEDVGAAASNVTMGSKHKYETKTGFSEVPLGYFDVNSGIFGKGPVSWGEEVDHEHMLYEAEAFHNTVLVGKYTHVPTLLYEANRLESRFWQITVFCILVLTIVIYGFASALTKKLVKVSHYIQSLDEDSFELLIATSDEDEIDRLISHINMLTRKVKALTEKKFETELQLKKTEIRALQNQITPHFLYNTLESFKMLALVNNQNELSTGLTSLGHLLRYYTNTGNRMSTLGAELKSVEDYVCIQNLLQKNRITLTMKINERLWPVCMPNLILQPIVENIVKHGTDSLSEPIDITIENIHKADTFTLKINDDGKGIDSHLIEELNTIFLTIPEISEIQETNHIGLINVNRRIRLLMGDQYGLYINPKVEKGTAILLNLPHNPPASAEKK